MKKILLLIYFQIALFSNDGISLDENHYYRIDFFLHKFLPNRQGSTILVGAAEETVKAISKRYPSVELTSLDFRDRMSWQKIIKEHEWENKFDCIFAMNILEKEADREGIICLVHSLLKKDGQGIVYINPSNNDSFDDRIESFVKNSKWNQSVEIVSGLPVSEYRKIIEKCGLSIVKEHDIGFIMYHSSVIDFERRSGDWLCNRLNIPFSYRQEFIMDFGESLIRWREYLWHYFPTYLFVIEKR